jgi:hypothetical protein
MATRSLYSALQWDMRDQIEAIVSDKGFDPNGKEGSLTHFQSIILSVLESPHSNEFVEYRANLILRLRKMGGVVSQAEKQTHLDICYNFINDNWEALEEVDTGFASILVALEVPLEE